MFPLHSLPETQAALALSIFLATFMGIWVGDMGLYGLGSSFGRRTAGSRWLQKYLRPESLAKAEGWFARHGSLALVMSRAIPGSRLPLYVAAGALRLPFRLFAKTTAVCSAVWVCAIFTIWRFLPRTSSGHQRFLPWLLTASVLFAPWLFSKSAGPVGGWFRKRRSTRDPGA